MLLQKFSHKVTISTLTSQVFPLDSFAPYTMYFTYILQP